jgi:glutamate:GABA antiporter
MMKTQKLSNFMLVAITVSSIVNLKSLALMASNGYVTLLLSLSAALFFLIPSTYVCAQLSSHFPQKGGVYEWVRHAFGSRWGFLAIWMEWINNVVAFPATLATLVGMFYLFIGYPKPSSILFTFSMLVILWLALLYNCGPIRFSGRLNVLGSLGTLFITVLIMVLGLIWLSKTPVNFSNLIPTKTDNWSSQIAIYVSFIGAYSGMQITGFHSADVANPTRQYRIALPISAALIMVCMLGSSFIMTLLIPKQQLNVIAGIEQIVQILFNHFQGFYLGNIVGTIILVSILASFSAWLIGPARGLQTALEEVGVKNFFTQLNRFTMPIGLLCLQGIITSLLISLFIVMPSIKSAFFLLIAITSQFTACMYILVFAAGFKLIARTLIGKTLCLLGMISCSIGFAVGIFAPSQMPIVGYLYTFLVLAGDVVILLGGWLFVKSLHQRKKIL